jgi:L-Ala-D/L-Glu epimerase
MRLESTRQTLRLTRPLESSYGSVTTREIIVVQLSDEDGPPGYGEAAPLHPYDGISIERAAAAIDAYAPILADARALNGAQIMEACRKVDPLPAALAAIDMALWDRAGRRAGKSIAKLLSDNPASSVPVNATLTALDRAGCAEQATRAVAQGYDCLKLKVGLGDDAGRLAAVRAAVGPQAALRLDANGAWDVEQAVRMIDVLSPAGLEFVEEPTHGIQAMREVRERVAVRVSIDETTAESGALAAGVADAVCLKISRCGGIAALIAAATLVRLSGAEVYLASTLDGRLGVAAALQAAAALASRGPMPHCGLATLDLFVDLENPLPALDGRIELPTGPGLGVEPP